jgi:hypothetical protein
MPVAFLVGIVLFLSLPVRADSENVVNPSERITATSKGQVESPPLPKSITGSTGCLANCAPADPEEEPDDPAPPILPQKTDIAAQKALRPTTCCVTKALRKESSGIQWRPFIREEFLFVVFEHGFRLATEKKTRRELGGPFFADWAAIISNTQWTRWSDGDKAFTSDLAHPAEGAVAAWIYRQNDTRARYLEQNFHNPEYRSVLLKSFAVATVTAVLWKIGPLSEATIGHVGLYPTVNKWGLPVRDGNRTGLNDYVLNEVGGIPLMVAEDWLDKHVAMRLESRIHSPAWINTVRIFTSPTRSFANLMSIQKPWVRENRK